MPKKRKPQAEDKQVNVRLDARTMRFLNQRRQLERLSLTDVIRTAVVAYIVGDLQITREPRGYIIPRADPDESPVVVLDPHGDERDEFTVELAGLTRQVGDNDHGLAPTELGMTEARSEDWSTRDLQAYLTRKLNRKVPYTALTRLLHREFGGTTSSSFGFSGPQDPCVRHIVRVMADEGVYTAARASQGA